MLYYYYPSAIVFHVLSRQYTHISTSLFLAFAFSLFIELFYFFFKLVRVLRVPNPKVGQPFLTLNHR